MAEDNNIPDGDDGGKKPPFPGMGTGTPSVPDVTMPPIDPSHRFFTAGGQPTPLTPSQDQPPPADNQPQAEPPADYKLWQQLNKSQLYTKPYTDFKVQFNNQKSVDKLYQGLNESQLYTKPKADFYNQFFTNLPTKEVADSQTFIDNVLKTPAATKAIDKLTGDQFYNNIYQQQQTSGQDKTRIQQPIPIRLPDQMQSDRDNFIQNVNDNPQLARKIITEIKRQNVDNPVLGFKTPKDINLNVGIDKSLATIDHPEDQARLKYNLAQIDSHNLTYNAETKQFEKPTGFGKSLVNTFKKNRSDLADYDYYTSHSMDDNIKYMDKKNANYDPYQPVEKPAGFWGGVGEQIGAGGEAMLKFGAGAVAGRLAGAAASAPELAIPLAAITTMGVGMGTMDFHHVAWKNTLEETYKDLKQKNPNADPYSLYTEAAKQANISGSLAMIQGLALGGEKAPEFTPVRYSAGAKKAFVDIIKNHSELLKSIVPEAGKQGTIAGTIQAVENMSQGKPIGDNLYEAGKGIAGFTLGLGLLRGEPGVWTPGGRANAVKFYSEAPEELVDHALNTMVQGGVKTPQDAQAIKQEVNSARKMNDGMPDVNSLTPEAEHLLQSIKDGGAKPAFISANLKKIATANGVEITDQMKPEDVVNALQNRKNSVKQPETFQSQDLGSGLSDIYKGQYEKDPEGFMKMVADQAHGGVNHPETGEFTSSRPGAEKAFGKPMVDAATAKYPEHIIAEPKPTETKGEIPIESEPNLKTLDYGSWKGKQESKESQEKIKQEILGNEPIGGTGEKLMDFANRVLPAAKNIIDNPDENTTIVTHSSVIKALNAWDEMGRPDKIDDNNFKDFANKYVAEKPEKEGQLNSFKSDKNGTTTHVIRHGETEDNKLSEFREDNTELTDKGKAQAQKAGEQLYQETKGNIPRINTSDLPRTEETTKIIINHLKSKQNAVPEQSTNEMGVREQGTVGETVGGRNTKPEEPTGQVNKQPNTEEKGKTEGEKEPRTVGVSHQSLKDIADKIGLEQPKEGDVLSPKEYSDRGQALLKAGADPDQLESDFKKDGLVNADRISVARAQYNKLVKDASDAYENNGKNSLEYQKAKAKADQWQKEVLKPMITKGFAETGRASQGETDIDTGSFVSMSRAFQDKYGKEPTPAQAKLLEEASGKVKDLTNKVSDLEQKLTEAIDKNVGTGKVKATYTEKAKAYADAFRKLKTKPFTFKDENGNEIDVHTAGIKWNDIVELGAKAIEKTGEIADGVKAAVDALKDADWYKTLSQSDKDKFATQLQAHYQENEPEIAVKDLGQKFADKTDSKFDPKDAKDIWQYAKDNYLHKGATFDDMINGVGTDLGLTNQQVRDAITSPKSAKVISDQMYEQQYRQQQAIRDANIALKTANQSKFERNYVVKFVKSLPSVWFTLKTFGHGTVGFVTHSGMNIFTPSKWGTFWHNFAKQFKFAFGGTTKRGLAAYQQEMTDLIHRPQFTFWKRNGLAVDPVKSYDDYQQFAKGVAKLGEMGDRGFNALKLQRYDLAEMYYNRLSDVEKSDPQTAKNIASIVNHSTGTADVPVPKLIGTAIFAPRLEASRWSRLAMEPGKAVKTLYNWKEASPADKVAAKIVGKRAGEMFATYMSALAANSAALTIAGSAQKINYTDPTQSDWLKFKAGDKTLDISGGMLSAMHFVGSLMKESIGQRKMVRGVPEPRSETMEKTVGGYVRGKLSPIASTVADVTSQADFTGRPLPFSSDKGTKYKPQYTWGEYIEDQQLPIPVSEGFKIVHDQMRDRGMDEATTNQIFNGIFSGVVSGATGARVSTDYSNDKHEAKTESKGKNHQ